MRLQLVSQQSVTIFRRSQFLEGGFRWGRFRSIAVASTDLHAAADMELDDFERRTAVRSEMKFAVQFTRVQILNELLQLARFRHLGRFREQVHVSKTVDRYERQIVLRLAQVV